MTTHLIRQMGYAFFGDVTQWTRIFGE